jgi:hypothetical protein
MKVGDVYKVRQGYTLCIGCNIFESGRVVELTDLNFDLIRKQGHKVERHEPVFKTDNKMVTNSDLKKKKVNNK